MQCKIDVTHFTLEGRGLGSRCSARGLPIEQNAPVSLTCFWQWGRYFELAASALRPSPHFDCMLCDAIISAWVTTTILSGLPWGNMTESRMFSQAL